MNKRLLTDIEIHLLFSIYRSPEWNLIDVLMSTEWLMLGSINRREKSSGQRPET